MIENNKENREKLASEKANDMELEDLIAFVTYVMVKDYENSDDETFNEEWEYFYGVKK